MSLFKSLHPRKLVRKVTVTVLGSSLLLAGWSVLPEVNAASNAVPGYEVKFLMNANKVLTSGGGLNPAVNQNFDIVSSPERLLVEYFDTNSLDLGSEDWNVRLRKKESKSDYELTYKKRFDVQNGQIDAALTTANAVGFDSSDDNYKAEVDWGYNKQTLSFSVTKSKKASKGLSLPSNEKALEMLVSEIPGKLDKTRVKGWGTTTLQNSRAHGPVLVTKYSGDFNGIEVYIEVWPILNAAGTGTESLVEISFKTDQYAQAAAQRTQLMNELQSEGWLVPADSLKTNLILDRY
ncbi:hypothetical protein [Saccharibacillus sp. JS10]|uniref:hypothetical protein n=1 Tax=Saccharibacillus sp. JS10 TaxID=2950552 RepID=UPI00210E6BFB|nr:hypothetical protein [Saccharibacillus sp. JS10]MCQ4085526.1 hypothetical protein [Saccharibacillus sp. JS10]